MKIGKIRKPWRSKREIHDLEREIIRIGGELQDEFTYLAYHMCECTSEELYERRINFNSRLQDARELAEQLMSCYWFNDELHPDYESVRAKIPLISNSIAHELADRKSERDRYRDDTQ